jgi:hypothetical protein
MVDFARSNSELQWRAEWEHALPRSRRVVTASGREANIIRAIAQSERCGMEFATEAVRCFSDSFQSGRWRNGKEQFKMVLMKQVRLIGVDGSFSSSSAYSSDSLHQQSTAFSPCLDVTNGSTVLEDAAHRLRNHPHFRGRSHWINAEFAQGCLVLHGCVPSFYLKQLAQEALIGIDGVEQLDNQIMVQCPVGVCPDYQESDAVKKLKAK